MYVNGTGTCWRGHLDARRGTWGRELWDTGTWSIGLVDVTYGTRGREVWDTGTWNMRHAGDVKHGTRGRALILLFFLCCRRRFMAFFPSQNVWIFLPFLQVYQTADLKSPRPQGFSVTAVPFPSDCLYHWRYFIGYFANIFQIWSKLAVMKNYPAVLRQSETKKYFEWITIY